MIILFKRFTKKLFKENFVYLCNFSVDFFKFDTENLFFPAIRNHIRNA